MTEDDTRADTVLPGRVWTALEYIRWSSWVEGIGQSLGEARRELRPIEEQVHRLALSTLGKYIAGALNDDRTKNNSSAGSPQADADDGSPAGKTQDRAGGGHARGDGRRPPPAA